MQTIITEKPSVAEDIAKVLGVSNKTKGYFYNDDYFVTWLLGHLVEIVPGRDPGWNKQALPFIPRGFNFEPVKENQAVVKERLSTIKSLLDKSEGVIIATDAAREGELIARNLLGYLKCNLPRKRLWISSLDEESIREGFDNLYPDEDFDNLAKSALNRTFADWVVGVNATRALTLSSQNSVDAGYRKVLSVGRVQTAVLKMICDRYVEHTAFVSEPYWTLVGTSVINGNEVKWHGTEKLFDRTEATQLRNNIMDRHYLKVNNVEVRRIQTEAPLPFDLDALQKVANSRYGYTLQETHSAVQSLYYNKYCSYPRTSSRYIPEKIFAKVSELLATVKYSPTYEHCAALMVSNIERLSRRCVNDSKLTDHHAIIITAKPLTADNDLSEVENNIYDLILCRFLQTFLPDNVADITTLYLSDEKSGCEFVARGRKGVYGGWKNLCLNTATNVSMEEEANISDIEIDSGDLSKVKQGDDLPITTLVVKEDKTRPTPLYTDATIVTEMETAGGTSEVGIGTVATRSGILETLVARDYIQRKNRKLIPKQLGLNVYEALKNKMVAQAEMTAVWEQHLEEIANGVAEPASFINGVKAYAVQVTNEILNSDTGYDALMSCINDMKLICPKCGQEMTVYENRVACRNEDCKFSFCRTVASKRLSGDELTALLRKGKTPLLTGFVSHSGATFNARLAFDENYKIVFLMETKGNHKKNRSKKSSS